MMSTGPRKIRGICGARPAGPREVPQRRLPPGSSLWNLAATPGAHSAYRRIFVVCLRISPVST